MGWVIQIENTYIIIHLSFLAIRTELDGFKLCDMSHKIWFIWYESRLGIKIQKNVVFEYFEYGLNVWKSVFLRFSGSSLQISYWASNDGE